VTYLILSFIAFGSLSLRDKKSFRKIIIGLQFAGLINVLYCAWVLAFGDFIGWSNPYGKILGLFGNPDFISAFLGIFNATLFATVLTPKLSWTKRAISGGLILLSFFEIVKSHAIQGIVVTAGGFVIVLFFWLRSRFQNKVITLSYSLIVVATGMLAVLGAFQKGPFSFVYKTSVSLRGAYWNAGITMGMNHPLTGVGMDSYGDWYRRARSLNAATVLPGPSTITNAAHNVVIDFFAYGGFPLLLAYLLTLALAAFASFRILRRNSSYDPTFVAMFAAWACYQVQSIISINQIGLAIWGWLLSGALISYEFVTRPNVAGQEKTSKNLPPKFSSAPKVISPQLVAGVGAVIGLLFAVPPFSADSNWRSALKSANAQKVMDALEPSFMNPPDSSRYSQAVQLFITNNLPDQAHQIAIKASIYNPNYFDAWRIIYFIAPTTPSEKELALQNMKRLDPLNPDVTVQP
jgi:O-antigen ligase